MKTSRRIRALAWVVPFSFGLGGIAQAQVGVFTDIHNNLGPGVNTSRAEEAPSISCDGLELYFARAAEDLFVSRREDTSAPFGPAERLVGVNSSSGEYGPCISPDGTELFFESTRTGDWKLHVATREAKDQPFGNVVQVEIEGSEEPTFREQDGASISQDGLNLYFSAGDVYEGSQDANLYVATREKVGDHVFGNLRPLAGINLPVVDEFEPSISADELTILWSDWRYPGSNIGGGPHEGRLRPGGLGSADIWLATRAAVDEPFGNITNLASPLNSEAYEAFACLACDWPAAGSNIYFTRSRGGNSDIYQATWVPLQGCELAPGLSGPDCNHNGFLDECEIAAGVRDVDQDGVPDDCQPDCNRNRVPDDPDIRDGTSLDCNQNAIPDECDIAGGASADLNRNDIPDDCEGNFVRGDCDGSAEIGINDGIFLLNFLFLGRRAPLCAAACDIDRAGELGVTAATRIFSYLFLGTRQPLQPFPDCGPPRQADEVLGCAMSHAHCE